MPWIVLQEFIILIRQFLNLLGKLLVEFPEILDWRDASQIGAAPFARVTDGFVREGVESARGDILLKLLVPGRRVET